ncbi:MAG TPA: hypothetical protein VH333_25865 [Pseudonocardiaceae bacterium]|jgi:hypothetical protein|nr:hypothetical protein [Pseudonocardiaceae bacterium]
MRPSIGDPQGAGEDSAFEQVAPGALASGWDGWRRFGGDEAKLIAAARSVRNVRIPQRSSSNRRGPLAGRVSIVAVCRAVLVAASGSLEIGQLVRVLLTRFPVVLDPVIMSVSDFEDDPAGVQLTPEDRVIAAETSWRPR